MALVMRCVAVSGAGVPSILSRTGEDGGMAGVLVLVVCSLGSGSLEVIQLKGSDRGRGDSMVGVRRPSGARGRWGRARGDVFQGDLEPAV